MYGGEHNESHYNHGDGPTLGQQLHSQSSAPRGPVQEMKPVKTKRLGLKIASLALCCALLGGAAGGGAAWWVLGQSAPSAPSDTYADTDAAPAPEETEDGIQVSSRTPNPVTVTHVDGETAMSDAEVYAANVNSVVSINTSATAGYNFFGQPVQSASAGSGFILTKDGYIATNYHVIKGADTVTVTLYSGESYDAVYVGGEEDYDIAVIKIDAQDLTPVTLGDSGGLHVGDHVLAIGNPLGELTFSMSGGMISCVDRAINVDGTPFNMIQTDASINPGNSGGPLFNHYGEVVGIVSAKFTLSSNGSAAEGLGFAIPMNDVFSMIKDIMTTGYARDRAYLGATVQSLTEGTAAQFHYSITSGVFISYVEEGSAAAKAGLQMGDVITKVNDTPIQTVEDLNLAKKKFSAGDSAVLEIYRAGSVFPVDIIWGAAPAEDAAAVPPQEESPAQQPGGSYGYSPFDDLFRYFYGYGG